MPRPHFLCPAEMVTFVVGGDFEGEEEKFIVHKEFAMHYSPTLKAAFDNKELVERRTQTYHLDDIRPTSFRLFLQWIYSQTLSVFTIQDLTSNQDPDNDLTIINFFIDQDLDLAQLWLLAERLLIPALQNEVMKQLLSKLHTNDWTTDWMPYAWANSDPGSVIRKFAVDLCLRHVKNDAYRDNPEHFPHELLVIVAACLSGLAEWVTSKGQLQTEDYLVGEAGDDVGDEDVPGDILHDAKEVNGG